MHDRSDKTLDRLGAGSGLAAVLLLLALFTSFPSLPAPDKPIGDIVSKVTGNAHALLIGAYVGALFTGALLVFGAVLATRIRRLSGAGEGWALIALIGLAGTSIGFVSNALVLVLVRAVGHGVRGDALWVAYGGDHWLGVLTGVPLAIFLLGAGLGARATGALPRWLAWLAVGLTPAFLLGAGSVIGDEVDGGPLGTLLVLAYLGLIVWLVGTSVALLRGRVSRPAGAAAVSVPA